MSVLETTTLKFVRATSGTGFTVTCNGREVGVVPARIALDLVVSLLKYFNIEITVAFYGLKAGDVPCSTPGKFSEIQRSLGGRKIKEILNRSESITVQF